MGAHFKVYLKDFPSSDWDVERISKVPYANVVGLVYGRDQRKHVDVDGFVDTNYAKDPNKGAIHLSRNAMIHERIKHINVRYHFIREIVESKKIKVANIGTKDNAADVFTNVVQGLKFKYCMEILGAGAN
ncbi:hypothetical protein Tco_0106964 [Tanacetum coccineum]